MHRSFIHRQHAIARRLAAAARPRTVVVSAIALMGLVIPQAASAAGVFSVTTSSHQAAAETAVTIKLPLLPSGTQLRHYGAQVTLPGALRIQFPAYGTDTQQCPSQARVRTNAPVTPVAWNFDPSGCPATAKIGTATLGAATGTIYMVSDSPLPQMGVYFDQGTPVPFGRRLDVTYNGTSAATLRITGLPNRPSTGLVLDFDAPDRPTLTPRIWAFTPAGTSECVPAPQATGTAWVWPGSGLTTVPVTLTPATLSLLGCDIGFQASAPPNQAGASAALTLKATVANANAGTRLYGARFLVPRSLVASYASFGSTSQRCAGSAVGSLSTGYTPGTRSFDVTQCPWSAVIGTAQLGDQSGLLYLINTTPWPSIGVQFTDGVDVPYSRTIGWDFDSTGASILSVAGLQGAPGDSLTLTFDNPDRADGLPNVWQYVEASDPYCASGDAHATIYTYPASGTVATATSDRYAYVPLSGCGA